MTNGNSELPELPAPRCTYADHSYPAFTKQQMIDYARSALSVCAGLQADGGKGEAVAWSYELATSYETATGLSSGEKLWSGWKKCLTDYRPNVPEGSIRNLVALAPQAECAPRADADTAGATNTPFSNCQFRECDLPGQCLGEGKCHHPISKRADAEKDAALTALAGLIHAYVGICRDSGIDPTMNTQYRNARAILAANKEKKA